MSLAIFAQADGSLFSDLFSQANLLETWQHLSATPLFGLTTTLIAYSCCHRLYVHSHNKPWLNPVVTTVTVIITFLLATGTSYESYFNGGRFIHFLLGPATVALAVPLYHQFSKLKKLWLPMSVTLVSGVTIAALSAVTISWVLGASAQTQLSLAPKSATAPVAMDISAQIGGLPSLTAVLVVTTGIIGSVFSSQLFKIMRIKDDNIKGIAMGITAHGIGTARAFQISPEMGAFAGLAMALSAFATAIIVPGLLQVLGLV
ncbi:MAG: LrgB family protein [Cyanobacteria bacterium J06598_1]